MIGQTIESPARAPWGAVVFALIGLGFVAGAVAEKNPHLAVFSALPFAIAIALWWAAARRMVLIAHEDRLEFIEPRRNVFYADILSATHNNPGKRDESLLIVAADATIRIPATVDSDLAELEQFLSGHVPPRPIDEPHPDMDNYVREQRETFGEERVYVYTTRDATRATTAKPTGRRGPTVCFAIMLVGIAWCFTPAFIDGKDAKGWFSGGVLAFVAFLCWIAYLQKSKAGTNVPTKLVDSCLVISPLGVAMIQGDVRGKLRWDEIRDVRNKGHNAGFQVSAANRGLFLVVEGSMVHVQNIYTAPLDEIEAKMRRNL